MSDVITVKGAKAGQEKARKPSIAKDSVASTSTAKLLYGLAEGEVYGLVDGGKSIRLDGTPLLDDNGSSNFEGVTWDFRHGTNEQEYIQGFPDVSNETGIGVELKSSQPFIKAFTDTQLSAIRVRFKWNRLSKTDDENGDVTGYKIDYAIDLQTDGGAYQNVLTTKIEDKTSAGYERTHRIDLPKANSGWQIRVRRITPNSDSEYIQDEMYIDAVAEVIDVKLAYPNTALLGIQYNAETFSGIAKMGALIRGMIIRVPSNYNAVARTYTGIWDGTFKDAYSNNPAWVYYDLCMQWRYGLGDRLDATMIDKWSLYTLGQYCDEQVSDGQGGLEPRYTCNVYLQKQADAYQVLQNIAGLFAALSYWNGEKIFVDADVPKDPVYTFSRANVIGGQFEYTGTRARDRHTIVKVAWDNPANNFETEYEYVRDDKAIAKFGVKVLDLAAFGCTSQGQAQRMGLRALKTEQLETRQVSFSVGLDGVNCGIGNIINVSDELFAGRANGGRVSTVNSTQRIIELDREVVASVGDVLIINGGTGKSERRNISNFVGNRITVTAGFTSAEPEHVWAIETADLKLMRFRVMQITENSDDNTYNIVGIQHEPQKYDAIDFGTDVKPTNITIVNPQTVDAPSAVTITSRHRVVQSQTIATLIIGWSQVKDAVSYDVEWRKDDGTWVKVPRTGNVSVEIDGVYSGNYLARVRAISPFDVQSQPTTSLLTAIEGKVGLPPVILGLVATGVLFGIELKWGFGAGSGDSDYTEIQTGSAPNTNVALLGQFSYPTNSHVITGLQGNLSQSYRARLVDKLGNKSEWSSWSTATTDASADKVLDLVAGKINESSLNTALTTKIAKIGTIETGLDTETQNRIDAIIDANSKINTERDARIADVLAATNAIDVNAGAIVAEQQARIAEVLNVNNKITAEQQARIAGLLAANEGISTETIQRKAADITINSRVDTVVSKTDSNTAAIASEVTTRTNADSALSTRIDTVVTKSAGNTAAITSEVTARTNADSALSTRIDTVTATSGGNKSAIQAETKSRTDADTALGSRIDTITASSGDNKAAIQAEAITRTDADTALGSRIDTVVTTVGNNKTSITSETTARTNADSALGLRIDTVSAKTGDNTAAIASETTARTNADSAITTNITSMGVKVDDNTSAISSESMARTNADSALSTRIDTITAESGSNKTAIQTEILARTTADTALGQRIDTVITKSGTNTSAIQTEVTARTNADSALSTRIDTVVSKSNSNTAAISSEATARTNADSALSTRIDTVSSKTDTNTATITTVNNTLTNSLGSQAEQINAIKADYQPDYFDKTKYFSSQAQQWTYAKSVARDNYAESQRITNLQAEVSDSNALFNNELLTLAETDQALVTDVTTLKADTANNNALIINESQTRTTQFGSLSQQVNTVQSQTTAAQSTANQAVTDAQNKSNQAKLDAIAAANVYADAQAIAKADAAQAAASTDASSKANAAKSQAIADAALDAKNKADAAQAAAESYAAAQDVVALNSAKADATQKANAAEQAAKTYALAAAEAKRVLAEAYADDIVTAEEQARIDDVNAKLDQAKADATTKANAAQAAASALANNAQTAATNAQATATEALGKANTATTNIATIQTDLQTVTTESGATASSLELLQTTVGGNTASIETRNEVIDGLKAQSTVKLDVNGYVVGTGTYNDGITGSFAVYADEFYVAAPNGSKTKTFAHYTTAQTINGVTIPVGTYLAAAYVASLSGGKIHANSITADRLVAKTITAESGVIDDLAVDTLQIKDRAVTIPAMQFQAAGFTFSATRVEQEINSITLDPKGGDVSVSFSFDRLEASAFGLTTGATVTLRLKKDGATIRTLLFKSEQIADNVRKNSNYEVIGLTYIHKLLYEYSAIAPFLDENVSAGDHTYSITLEGYGVNESRIDVSITGRTLQVMGVKK